MGGIVCAIPRNAILRFEGIPQDKRQLARFDEQLRQCFVQPQIVEGVVETGHGVRVCELLAKEKWTDGERYELYHFLEGIYE